MKTLYKFAMLMLMASAISLPAAAQDAQQAVVKPLNIVRGIVGPAGFNTNWGGFSSLSLIGGAGVIPVVNKAGTTVFYLGFTGGTTADVSNMVLYTTPRGRLNITAVTPVKRGGVSNPSIALSNATVCAIQPSQSNPCIVRLDPVTFPLSTLSDYYLVLFFTANDPNNTAIGASNPPFLQSSLSGWFTQSDQTHLTVGQSVPTGNNGSSPNFLMYVMTN
ncbi:MAG: hypothetical protein HY010_23000 [Acidobacteria bacterium]|nr:hypothetical protein [Acidobacteriota bacterium]